MTDAQTETITVISATGTFAENKEHARTLRRRVILPRLKKSEHVILDFTGVAGATQSFIHALIAEAVRQSDPVDGLDLMEFRGCSESVKSIIEIVVSYCQDDWSTNELTEIPPTSES